jgi:DNA-binding response OmpR family regulator
MAKIMIVEDDFFIREELTNIFLKAGYKVMCITSFKNTVQEIIHASPDLVLLDLNLPGVTGFDICRSLKANGVGAILVLTSRDQLKDELHALELGADDFLTKPCNRDRLLARVQNLLRRFETRKHILDGNGFLLDQNTYALYVNDISIILSENEGKILEALLKHSPEVVSKEELFQTLWGTLEYIDENALQVNLARLRKTLRQVNLDWRIETVRGIGYRLKEGEV